MNVKKLVLVIVGCVTLAFGIGIVVGTAIATYTPRGVRQPVATRQNRPIAGEGRVGAVTIRAVSKIELERELAEDHAKFVGTHIVLTDERPVGDPKLRKAIADAFAQLDPLPPSRKAYFAWTGQHGYEIIGWSGVIDALEQTRQGWVVDVQFHANFSRGNVRVFPHGERWLFDRNGNLTMLGSLPKQRPSGPGSLMID
jgi:hypothetical protein